ncbi:hypothetical protein CQW23_34361 [Capsicum baccatum]|uniref:Serine/threonine-protein kinase TOR n=1 Tax=Capsicum baccatum TaxID=33114 RepID=A0A2G2UZ89_CAPBA|nr:hypothetical protein CQW23_34361 [Capsicum baccatum]
MGSSSQAIRYPVATIGAENIDALNRVLVGLCTRSNPKDGAALTLRRLVEEEARDLSGEAFVHFMDHLYELITTFIDSNEVSKNLGALRAMDELIDVTISKNVSKVAKFSNYMSAAFETNPDPEILVFASKVLGHLDRSGGAMTIDVKVSLKWLRGERIEYHRFSAVLILKVLVGVKDRFLGDGWLHEEGGGQGTSSSYLRAIFSFLYCHVCSYASMIPRESVVMYLEDEDVDTRKDVALCCCKLVANSFSVISSTQFSLSRINCASGKRCRRLVEEV